MDGLIKIKQILEKNKNKTFVDRILNPNNYPRLDLGGGNFATHKMSWMQVGDKYHVFPTVLWDGKNLNEYTPEAAYEYVKQSGNYIEFDSPEEADWFSKRYKDIWDK